MKRYRYDSGYPRYYYMPPRGLVGGCLGLLFNILLLAFGCAIMWVLSFM